MGLFSKNNNEGASVPERVSRRLQATGQRIGGERGGRIANRVSDAIGCGRIEFCDNPGCPDCAPVK